MSPPKPRASLPWAFVWSQALEPGAGASAWTLCPPQCTPCIMRFIGLINRAISKPPTPQKMTKIMKN